MKKLILLVLTFSSVIIVSCNNISSQKYDDITSSLSDRNLYELVDVKFQDGMTIGSISIPNYLKRNKSADENNVFHYQFIGDNYAYVISLDKLKSRNTVKVTDKEYMDISSNQFKNTFNEDLSEIAKILPLYMKDVKVIDLKTNLIINEKYFLRRLCHFYDNRQEKTFLSKVPCTNFFFSTLHNKNKYDLSISYYGNDKGFSELVGLFNTIGGSIKFN